MDRIKYVMQASKTRHTNDWRLFRSYSKRYAMSAMLGLASDTDDDGNSQTYTSNDYGLFVASGNVARFEGGAEFVDSNYYIKQDAALIIKDTNDRIVAKFGSVGLGAIGMVIGVLQVLI